MVIVVAVEGPLLLLRRERAVVVGRQEVVKRVVERLHLPIGVFACTSRIISGKHVPQDVSAPSIVKVQSEELSEPLLRL